MPGAAPALPIPAGAPREIVHSPLQRAAQTATAAAAVRGTPGGVYNIGGGSRVSLLEVFDMIGRIDPFLTGFGLASAGQTTTPVPRSDRRSRPERTRTTRA